MDFGFAAFLGAMLNSVRNKDGLRVLWSALHPDTSLKVSDEVRKGSRCPIGWIGREERVAARYTCARDDAWMDASGVRSRTSPTAQTGQLQGSPSRWQYRR